MSADAKVAGFPQYAGTRYRVTFGGLVRSEWIKFWSVRSVVVTMVASVVAIVGLGVLIAWGTATTLADPETGAVMTAQGFDATAASLQGAQMATLIVAAVGVIVIAGEFSTGMVRTSFAAAPGRLGVYAAKALVLAVSVAVLSAVAVLLAFLGGQALLDREGVGASLGDDGVVRALAGNVAMLVGVALAGLGVGALLRNTAGAISTVLAAIFVVPLLLMLVPESWGGDTIREYWFSNAVMSATAVAEQPDYLGVVPGLAVFAAWVAVLLGLGALSLKSRDV
ncbi:ABC transporter permease [Paenibacillus sp. TRM 82003]|uniref:ABC transporter permease n=1 Tax=Kineococcus sp. TRM81007 TaxID=2925831 RepID=UPI001F587DB9|nr:ABC transporter permease [Kineococcus sp. TRM81007]MCI2238902.1 ABC transporter permease [Kineococcus sp. TRM81007]MCI3924308.1 ABC transporter permease [Paenibacillus sp. TRM 82003]